MIALGLEFGSNFPTKIIKKNQIKPKLYHNFFQTPANYLIVFALKNG